MRQLHKELSHNDGDGVRLPKAGDGIAVKACVRLSPAAARRRAARPQHAAGRSIVPRRPHHLAHPRHGSCAVGCCGVVGGADTHTTAPAVHRYARRRRQAAALLCHALPDCGLLRGVHVLCGCCARACACVWVCTARVVSCFQVTTAAGPPAGRATYTVGGASPIAPASYRYVVGSGHRCCCRCYCCTALAVAFPPERCRLRCAPMRRSQQPAAHRRVATGVEFASKARVQPVAAIQRQPPRVHARD